MDKAKQAVNSFMSKAGHHDTTVHETVAPAVTNETVKEQHHEETQVARDREVHQDHHHTSIQPVQDQEVLAEQHHHRVAGVEHKTYDNRDAAGVKQRLEAEAAQFKNESHRENATHRTTNAVPELGGEHVHHHVHETIQPVIHKETIEPHVTHTTIPVHETHHKAAQHHTASALPAINMSDFKSQGGSLTGREATTDHFTGEPRSTGHHAGSGLSHGSSGQHTGAMHDSSRGTHGATTGSHGTTGITGTTGMAGSTGTTGTTGTSGTSGSTGKPSMMDKLNPKIDADGDGKAGFMS